MKPTPFYGQTLSFDDDRFRAHFTAVLISLAAQRERRLAKQAGPPSSDAHGCSFCDLHRDAVAKLINGPRVYICEACVATAARTVGDELRRQGTAS